MGKAKEVVGGGRLGGREVEELAFAAYGIGSSLLRSSTSNGKDIGESNSGASIVWLLEASDLLENREEGFAKDMHVSRLSDVADWYSSSFRSKALDTRMPRSSLSQLIASTIRLAESRGSIDTATGASDPLPVDRLTANNLATGLATIELDDSVETTDQTDHRTRRRGR